MFSVLFSFSLFALSPTYAAENFCEKFNQVDMRKLTEKVNKMDACVKTVQKLNGTVIPIEADLTIAHNGNKLHPPFLDVMGVPSFRLFMDQKNRPYRMVPEKPMVTVKTPNYSNRCMVYKGKRFYLRQSSASHSVPFEILSSCPQCNLRNEQCSPARLEPIQSFHSRNECVHTSQVYGKLLDYVVTELLELHQKGYYKTENRAGIKLAFETYKEVAELQAGFPDASSGYVLKALSAGGDLFECGVRLTECPLYPNLERVLNRQTLLPIETLNIDALMSTPRNDVIDATQPVAPAKQ